MQNKFIKLRTLLFLLITLTLSMNESKADFKLRNADNCEDLNPEMSQWFKTSEKMPIAQISPAPIEQTLGPIKHQKVGWCFAFAAADMLSQVSGYNISGAHIAKNYYAKSIKAWIWGGEESGTIKDALEINLKTPLCDEHGYSSKNITNIESAKKYSCRRFVTELYDYEVKSVKGSGYYDGFILFDLLDETLLEGQIAGIHYDSSQLTNERKLSTVPVRADHASTVVARYFDKKDSSCRYVIRNTYGNNCKPSNNKSIKCVNGYYSVPEVQMTRMLITVVALKSAR
jgi:hypothetical protein